MPWTEADLLETFAGRWGGNREKLARGGKAETMHHAPLMAPKRRDAAPAEMLPADLPPFPSRRAGLNREAVLQRRIVMALRRAGYAAMAVNGEVGLGGKTGMLLQMTRAAMGYAAGTPDVIVALPRGRVLWLEVKTPPDPQGVLKRVRVPRGRGGSVDERQAAMHALLRSMGHSVATVRGEDEAVVKAREETA